MLPKLAAAGCPGPLSVLAPLTWKPVPGVENNTPRGEFTLKNVAGSSLGAAKLAGTASQLISRRRPPKEPFAPATVPPPKSVRNASRVAVISAAVAPVAVRTTICAKLDEAAISNVRQTANPAKVFANFIEQPPQFPAITLNLKVTVNS